jgi:uncharacterized protein DUF1573
MRPRIGPFLAVAIFLGLTASAHAQLQFAQPTADWGEVKRGPSLVQRFHFVNGPRAIQIDGAKTSCGCLTPRVPQELIEPGQAGHIDLEVNTLSQPAGPNTWKLTLICQDAKTKAVAIEEVTLYVRAKLIAELAIEPASLNLITDKPIAHVVTLTDYRPQPLQVTSVQASKPELRAQLLPPRRDEQGRVVHAVQVQVAPNFPEGQYQEVVSLYTSDPEYRELRVPVSVVKHSRQRVTATPERVAIAVQGSQGTPSQVVLIRDADDQLIEIDNVVANHPAVQCRWARSPNGSVTLRVQIDATQVGSQSFKSEVEVHVTRPQVQVLRIPVDCQVTPGL